MCRGWQYMIDIKFNTFIGAIIDILFFHIIIADVRFKHPD